MNDVLTVAEAAEMIVNGYAFTLSPQGVRVLNLNNPIKAAVISMDEEVIETSMDDIELQIVLDYFISNK